MFRIIENLSPLSNALCHLGAAEDGLRNYVRLAPTRRSLYDCRLVFFLDKEGFFSAVGIWRAERVPTRLKRKFLKSGAGPTLTPRIYDTGCHCECRRWRRDDLLFFFGESDQKTDARAQRRSRFSFIYMSRPLSCLRGQELQQNMSDHPLVGPQMDPGGRRPR